MSHSQTNLLMSLLGMLPHGFPPVFSFTALDAGLPASETTVGEVAKAAGYRTAYLGTY